MLIGSVSYLLTVTGDECSIKRQSIGPGLKKWQICHLEAFLKQQTQSTFISFRRLETFKIGKLDEGGAVLRENQFWPEIGYFARTIPVCGDTCELCPESLSLNPETFMINRTPSDKILSFSV